MSLMHMAPMHPTFPRARITELKRWLGAEQLIFCPAECGPYGEPAVDPTEAHRWAVGMFDSVLWVGGPSDWTVDDNGLEVLTELAVPTRPSVVWLEASPELLPQLRLCQGADVPVAVLVARTSLFLSPPPDPARLEEWPTLADVVDVARFGDEERYLAVWEDVLYSVPQAQALAFAGSLQHEAGRAAMERTRAESLLIDARSATQTLATLGRTLLSRARDR